MNVHWYESLITKIGYNYVHTQTCVTYIIMCCSWQAAKTYYGIAVFYVVRGEVVSLANIERIHKRRKHDKESRLATVMVRNFYLLKMYQALE